MSGQWEIVSKKKDKNFKNVQVKIINNKDKKEPANLQIKLEEVLPKSQLKHLYNNERSNNKLNLEKNNKDSMNKINNKQKWVKKLEKSKDVSKTKPPKSIESGLLSIDINEMQSIYDTYKNQFPDAPIIWLKQLVQFLNQKLSLYLLDPVFSTKPNGYPLTCVPHSIMNIFQRSIEDSGETNTQLFFVILLTALTTDMNKNLPVLGYKIFLQYIARNHPHLVVANLNKHSMLRDSYQNRVNIGLSILWTVGQAGFADFSTGLLILKEFMWPLIEMKNYSRFIVNQLYDTLNTMDSNVPLMYEDFLFVLETIYTNRKNFPTDMKPKLEQMLSKLKQMLLIKNNGNDYETIVDIFIKRLYTNNDKSYHIHLCDIIVMCFERDSTCLFKWKDIYLKNITSSVILLNYMYDNCFTSGNKIDKNIFYKFINDLNSTTNLSLKNIKKKDVGLTEASALIDKLLKKMTETEKKSKLLSLNVCVFILTSLLCGIVAYDVIENDGWKNTRMRQALIDLKICDYGHKVVDKINGGLFIIDGYIEKYLPGYKQKIIYYTQDYVELFYNLGIILSNMIVKLKLALIEQYPVLRQTIDTYAPGFLKSSQNTITNVWSMSIMYFNQSVDYLRNEVFVGQLSPENMQKVVVDALNITQLKASEYYHWLYKKVQTSIK